MDLTPIKIRGKKRRHPTTLATTKLQALDSATSSDSQVSTQAKRRRRVKKQKNTTPAMPTLQGLPQELLEIIFLYSGNIYLPLCSPSIGRRLSSHAVAMDFVMQSFFHTVDHKANIQNRKVTSDPLLQSILLSCRFFTWDFFLAYVRRAHDTLVKQRGKAWQQTSLQLPGVEEFDNLWPFRFTKIPYLAFAEGFHVPEKLLHGPWTRDRASLLYVLVSMNGEIGWSGSLSGETAKAGIREAIKEGNEHAVAALSVLLGVPKALGTDILRYAVIDCGCDFNIMRHLLYNAQILGSSTSEDMLNFLDPQLWLWADEHPEKGIVLKDMLRKAYAFDLEFYFEEDADWTKIVSFPYGASKFDTRAAFDDLTRELLMNLYKNYGRKITRRRIPRRDEERRADGMTLDEFRLARQEEVGMDD